MRRLLCFALVLLLVLSLSSCSVYSQTDLDNQYAEGYDDGYEYGYEVGCFAGYEEGLADGWDSFLYEDFEDYWEDWLIQEYGITEQELCVLLSLPTDTPKSTATPSPSPTPSPTARPTPTATPAPTAIPYGFSNSNIKVIQFALSRHGYSFGGADGVYGPKTEAAIKQLQKDHNLPQTGIIDSKTSSALWNTKYWIYDDDDPTATPRPTATPAPSVKYIGNRNTGKFHYTWCSSVDQMKSSNKVYMYYRSEATSRGYVPCKRCDP